MAGIIDVIPMIIMRLTWDVNFSGFFFWIIDSFVIASSNLRLKGWLKGLLITLLLQIPILFLASWKNIGDLSMILPSTIMFGSLLGFFIGIKN